MDTNTNPLGLSMFLPVLNVECQARRQHVQLGIKVFDLTQLESSSNRRPPRLRMNAPTMMTPSQKFYPFEKD